MKEGGVTGRRRSGRPTNVCWERYPEAARLFLRGVTVPVAGRVAVVVGAWLTLINQGGRIAAGSVPWVKVSLNFLTPFTVSSIGFLAARRRATLDRLWAQLHHESSDEEPASAGWDTARGAL